MAQPNRHKHQNPLDVLQSMINGVLLETGKTLHAANKKGLSTLGHDNIRFQGVIPNTIDKFHLALDELESDIIRARAVLNRDLQEIRARQYAIDHPGTEQPNKSEDKATQNATESEDSTMNTDEQIQEPSGQLLKQEPSNDQQSNNSPTHNSETETQMPEAAKIEPLVVAEEPISVIADSKDPKEQENKENKSLPEAKSANDQSGINTTTNGEVAQNTAAAQNQGGENQDIDFESMFGVDGAGGEPNNETSDINFDDMMFSNAGGENSNLEFGDHADLDLSSFGDQNNNGHEDVTAMLEGLENFGNASNNDFNMMEMSNSNDNNDGTNTTGNQNTEQSGNANGQGNFSIGGGDLDMALDLGNNESSFDDLLDGIDFGDGGDDGTGLDSMEHGEFDDAFFGME